MPRQRGGARPAARPAPPPSRPSQQQTRQASSVPARTTQPAPPAQTNAAQPPAAVPSQGGGMLSNIVSTAAGVGIGHAIGHGLTGLFSGGSSTPEAAAAAAPAVDNSQQQRMAGACEADAKAFTKCMDDFKGDMNVCSWYLDQLKSCQQMASQY